MVHDDRAARGAAETPLNIAILEQDSAIQDEIGALVEQALRLELKVPADAADYFEVYGTSQGPDILLVGLDENPQQALTAAKQIVALSPTCGVIVYGRTVTMELLSQAMVVGARRHLQFPFDAATLRATVTAVSDEMRPLAESARMALPAHQPVEAVSPAAAPPRASKVIAVFSPKGGVGTSTLAVNLACALATFKRRVVIVDGNISFGNVGVFLNISPSKSMLQLIGDPNGITEAAVRDTLLPHSSGVKVLLAPLKPEEADNVHGDHLRGIIAILQKSFDYVVVDTWPSYDERVLAMLEAANQVLVPMGPELPSIKNIAAFLRVTRLLGYPKDKLVPVLVRSNTVSPGHLQDIESFLKQPLVWRIVSDGKRVTQSVNNGEPFVLTSPAAPVSQNIFALAYVLDGQEQAAPAAAEEQASQPFWKRMRLTLGKAG